MTTMVRITEKCNRHDTNKEKSGWRGSRPPFRGTAFVLVVPFARLQSLTSAARYKALRRISGFAL